MNRTKGILAALTFTGLLLITILALGFSPIGNSQAQPGEDTAVDPMLEPALPAAKGMTTNEETLQAWQEYSAQLEQTIKTLQERDTAYQQQIDTANATILQLQDQVNNNSSPSFREEHEERGEHEEHEREEHEAFEFGEFDD